MANPVEINLTANVYTKVATDVTGGYAKKLSNSPAKYLETYRLTGQPVPTNRTEGAEMFVGTNKDEIESPVGIDCYIMPIGADGKVRMDLQ